MDACYLFFQHVLAVIPLISSAQCTAHAHAPGKVGATAGSQSAVPGYRRLAALGG